MELCAHVECVYRMTWLPSVHVRIYSECIGALCRHFSTITKDKTHMKVACAAAAKSSYTSMQYPRQFEKPSILAGLAMAMGPLIAPITRTPITPTVAACLGDKDSKLKVSCVMSDHAGAK